MRKSSVQLVTQTSEPLIVVDETGENLDEDRSECSSSEESPTKHFQSQFLLSPWRDARETRKLSLPSPQCSGITASQVRRLSERGETGGPGPRQTEFLATLSQAPAPTPGGRRHSVVTISKVPPSLFGRNRRESVAAFPNRVLSSRRESMTGPPSTEPRGSVHNLQLDIMDDIVQSRKVRMKLWNTSNEKVCELKDESGTVHKYTAGGGSRRYSDFIGTTLAPIPSSSKRRASELPPLMATDAEDGGGGSGLGACKQPTATGIVCSNTDLISILSHLTSSAMDINQQASQSTTGTAMTAAGGHTNAGTSGRCEMKGWEARRARLRANRSSSFDASVLHKVERMPQAGGTKTPSDWFIKRHLPMAAKTRDPQALATSATFVDELEARKRQVAASAQQPSPQHVESQKKKEHKVLWDENSGSVVDAQVLGYAIEDFLRRDSQLSLNNPQMSPANTPTAGKGAIPKKSPQQQQQQQQQQPQPHVHFQTEETVAAAVAKPKGWFGSTSSNNPTQDTRSDSEERETASASCESSICATLKDLFVK